MYVSDEGEFGKGTCLRLFSFYLSIIAPFVALNRKKVAKTVCSVTRTAVRGFMFYFSRNGRFERKRH